MPWKETARSFADARLSTEEEMEADSTLDQHRDEEARLESLSDRILRKFVRNVVKNRPLTESYSGDYTHDYKGFSARKGPPPDTLYRGVVSKKPLYKVSSDRKWGILRNVDYLPVDGPWSPKGITYWTEELRMAVDYATPRKGKTVWSYVVKIHVSNHQKFERELSPKIEEEMAWKMRAEEGAISANIAFLKIEFPRGVRSAEWFYKISNRLYRLATRL